MLVILEAVIFDAAELYCFILYFICPVYINQARRLDEAL